MTRGPCCGMAAAKPPGIPTKGTRAAAVCWDGTLCCREIVRDSVTGVLGDRIMGPIEVGTGMTVHCAVPLQVKRTGLVLGQLPHDRSLKRRRPNGRQEIGVRRIRD